MDNRTSVKAKLFRKLSKNLSDYCIYVCSTTDYSHLPPAIKKEKKTYITITGTNIPAIESVEIEYFGEWVTKKKYGLQFKADSYQFVSPKTVKGVESFLKSKAFPGIGPKTAELIAKEYGLDTFDTIKNRPNLLLSIPGITPAKVGSIVNAFKRNEAFSSITVFLSPYGLSADSIARINEKYGENAVDKIKQSPYSLQQIRGIGFKTCDKIARGLNIALNSYDRIRGGIMETIKSHIQETGDTCIGVTALETGTLHLLNEGIEPAPVSSELFRTAAKKLAEKGEIVFRNKEFVFLKEYDDAEENAAKKLISMSKADVKVLPLTIHSAVEEYNNNAAFKLSNNQIEAVKTALSNRVSIITGGPGTGKTTILSAIIAVYKKLFHGDVTLLAPTSKAARRMTEQTGFPASTIHSKIGIFDSASRFIPIKIPSGIVIVDESSMVDALLLAKLLYAVPDDSQILFTGDVDQLPSVSAGSVLDDMIKSEAFPVVRLTEIFRQASGGSIIENAQKINKGNKSISYSEDFQLIKASSEEEAAKAIQDAYEKEVKAKGIDNVALLSPLRRSQNGRFIVVAEELNDILQDCINKKANQESCTLYNTEYRVGDRVLQWKNTAESSNGDVGEITAIYDVLGDVNISVHWDNGNDSVETRQTMADITLAYAISIHKSQGSEYSTVIIPILSTQKCHLFKRALIYTAITRARNRVIIVGDSEAINYCIDRCDIASRTTLFKERLRKIS